MRFSTCLSALVAASPLVAALPAPGLNWLESITRRTFDSQTGMATCDLSRVSLRTSPPISNPTYTH